MAREQPVRGLGSGFVGLPLIGFGHWGIRDFALVRDLTPFATPRSARHGPSGCETDAPGPGRVTRERRAPRIILLRTTSGPWGCTWPRTR